MPRPQKCRRVCSLPIADEFTANATGVEPVTLTVDEYECIRLVDHLGLSQAECALQMQVSRATAQLICDSARGKLARALCEGRSIRISGGVFSLCDASAEHPFCKRHCRRRGGV